MRKKIFYIFAILIFLSVSAFSNPWNGKVILQGFWWDYHNDNYPINWATYLAKLAPRLREMGIDAVWVPPSVKNHSTSSNGYAPFDHYDLGDKYQKFNTSTRLGNKDEYLRMIAVLHANGIEVIQDVVWNHLANAGTANGEGGEDPEAWSNKYKNFRYACYKTPASSATVSNYLAREGRFPKNWQNFHPNPDHNQENDDWTSGQWGPDLCYYQGAYGQSSNATYNPVQSPDYVRNGMRAWNIWMKKQTGIDGFRIDAAKHFPYWATKDFLWNLAYDADWASGGETMIAFGEYVGSKSEMDQWVDDVNNSDGFTDVVGTMDFSLRQALHDMVYGFDNYDMGSIPGAQQDRRNRTVPFVNTHDTFRPILDENGNYDSWDTDNEIGGHVDPREPRVEAAYAIAMAVDGSPSVFFEDLFDIGSNGNRWTHNPESESELPARDFMTNLIWCHQKLNFKDGAYKVRWQAQDLLVIERSAKALICANDNWANAQTATVQTDFGPNVELKDYSGANSATIWTDGDGRATIWVPPCDGSNIRRGYCVWGPVGIEGGFSPSALSTTQEWEMADDLGDRHPNSLRQGGRLPAASTDLRTICKIWGVPFEQIVIDIFPELNDENYTVELYSSDGIFLTSFQGSGAQSFSYTPGSQNWLVVKIRNSEETASGQKIWAKITYNGPQDLVLDDPPLKLKASQNKNQIAGMRLLGNYPNPFNPSTIIRFLSSSQSSLKLEIFNLTGQKIFSANKVVNSGGIQEWPVNFSKLLDTQSSAVYLYRIFDVNKNRSLNGKMIFLK